MTREERIAALKAAAKERMLILDGAMGMMIQRTGWTRRTTAAKRFKDHAGEIKGNNDMLCLTQAADRRRDPRRLSRRRRRHQRDQHLQRARHLARASTALEAACATSTSPRRSSPARPPTAGRRRTPDKPRFVAGAIGPTSRMLSISPT